MSSASTVQWVNKKTKTGGEIEPLIMISQLFQLRILLSTTLAPDAIGVGELWLQMTEGQAYTYLPS